MKIYENKYLADILEGIANIEAFTGPSKLFDQYDKNKMLQSAVNPYI